MDDTAAGETVGRLGQALRARGWRVATAESCTGGLVAAACTALAGSSDWFERGFVTYSNAAKVDELGVDAALIERHGAVSEAVARAMAAGALVRASAQLTVAITGIAGPGGAVPGKPVGTVWVAWAVATHAAAAAVPTDPAVDAECLRLAGDRDAVRTGAVHAALQGLLDRAAPRDDRGR